MTDNSNIGAKLIAAIIFVMSPITPVLLAVTALICIDFGTGLWAAYKNNVPITSRKMGETVAKLILMNIGVIAAFITETYIIPEIPLVKILAGFVALVELQSIFENAFKATGNDIFRSVKEIISRKKDEVKNN